MSVRNEMKAEGGATSGPGFLPGFSFSPFTLRVMLSYMHYVYILYSEKIDKYYIGITHSIDLRVHRHNSGYYENKWSAKGVPWSLFFSIKCSSKSQAFKIEQHIKAMKSKTYLRNLKKHNAISKRLLTI